MIPVKVDAPKGGLPELWEWCYSRQLEFVEDWEWNRPDSEDGKYTFLFREEKYAIMFSLRWL